MRARTPLSAAPPQPAELAQDLVAAVARHVRFDLEPLRAALAERLAEPDDEDIRPRAERIAGDAIDAEWPQELLDECERALAEAHEDFLVRAARCLELARDLEAEGRESWIAQAIPRRLAFDASRALLAARDERVPLDEPDGQEVGAD